MRLACFALAARKLPAPFQVSAMPPTGNQEAPVAFDYGGDDDDGRDGTSRVSVQGARSLDTQYGTPMP